MNCFKVLLNLNILLTPLGWLILIILIGIWDKFVNTVQNISIEQTFLLILNQGAFSMSTTKVWQQNLRAKLASLLDNFRDEQK